MAELPMTHAGLQKAVTDLCDWLDIWWWHDTDSRRNKSGLPDLLIIGVKYDGQDKPAELWREIKVPPDDLRPGQRKFRDRALAAVLPQDLPQAEQILRRSLEHRTGRVVLPMGLEDEVRIAFRNIDPTTGEKRDGDG